MKHIKILVSHYFLLCPLLVDLNVDGIQCQEVPNLDKFVLSVPPQPTNCLRLTSVINLLAWREKWRKEYGVVGRCEIRTASAFVHHVQEEHPFLTFVLVFLEVLALLRRRATYLEEFDLVHFERVGDFGHQVRKLDKYEDTFLLGNRVSAICEAVSKRTMQERNIPDQVDDHFQFLAEMPALPIASFIIDSKGLALDNVQNPRSS